MTEDVLAMNPEGWEEIQRILEGKSILSVNEQAFLLWFGGECIDELLQSPIDVKKMCRETGLSTRGKDVAEGLLKKMRARQTELEKAIP
jgi:hypothetical protein